MNDAHNRNARTVCENNGDESERVRSSIYSTMQFNNVESQTFDDALISLNFR